MLISVERGRFAFNPRSEGPVRVSALVLRGRPVRVQRGQVLSEEDGNIIRCTWERMEVRVSVRDAITGRDLPRVNVFASSPGFEGFDGFGPSAIGPSRDAPVVVSNSPSPVTLPIAASGLHHAFWIAHEGYVPFLYRFPSGLPLLDVSVSLERSSSTVQVVVDAAAAEDYEVGVYGLADSPTRAVGEPLRSYSAAELLTISDLPAARYAFSLEKRREHTHGTILDTVMVDLTEGADQRVRLTANDFGRGSQTGIVAFVFEGDQDVLSRNVNVVPLSLSAQHQQARSPVHTGGLQNADGVWGPAELLVGEYALRVTSSGRVFRFTVEPGCDDTYRVTTASTRPHYLTFLDAGTGETVPLRSVSWCAPMTFGGHADLDNASGLFSVTNLSQPIEIVAPSAQIRIEAFTQGYGIFRATVDLSAEPDPILLLPAPSCLEVVADSLDQIIAVSWLEQTRLQIGARRVEVDSVEVVAGEHSTVGRVFFDGQGETEITFQPLSSYGELPSATLEFEAGDVRRIDLANLIAAR